MLSQSFQNRNRGLLLPPRSDRKPTPRRLPRRSAEARGITDSRKEKSRQDSAAAGLMHPQGESNPRSRTENTNTEGGRVARCETETHSFTRAISREISAVRAQHYSESAWPCLTPMGLDGMGDAEGKGHRREGCNMVAWIFAFALIAAEDTDKANLADPFTLESASPIVYLSPEVPGRTPNYRSLNYQGFFTIRRLGKLPEHGLFVIGKESIEPSMRVVAKGTRSKVQVKPEDNRFTVVFPAPGTYTFIASAGKWSESAEIVVKAFPIGEGYPAKDLIQRHGPPDDKHGKYWVYKKWPGIVLTISGDPGRLYEFQRVPSWAWTEEGLVDWDNYQPRDSDPAMKAFRDMADGIWGGQPIRGPRYHPGAGGRAPSRPR